MNTTPTIFLWRLCWRERLFVQLRGTQKDSVVFESEVAIHLYRNKQAVKKKLTNKQEKKLTNKQEKKSKTRQKHI